MYILLHAPAFSTCAVELKFKFWTDKILNCIANGSPPPQHG